MSPRYSQLRMTPFTQLISCRGRSGSRCYALRLLRPTICLLESRRQSTTALRNGQLRTDLCDLETKPVANRTSALTAISH